MKNKIIIAFLIVLNILLLVKIILMPIKRDPDIHKVSLKGTLYESFLINGKSAPNIILRDLRNERQELIPLLGDKRSLLVVYSDVSCNPCVDSLIIGCNSLANKSQDKYKIIGIAYSRDINYVRRFARVNNIRFPFLLDDNANLVKELNLKSLPVIFMLDKNHNIINSFFIDPYVRGLNPVFFMAANRFLNGE